jgi:ATPase components of ABC transporters with duplicated ATPase domains
MLDEPTNYLDIMSVIWLQNYLDTVSSTVLVVAHDREFIDAITQETIILRNKTLTYFDGNLTRAERHARTDRKGKIRMKDAMDRKKTAIEKSIEMGAKSAKKTGDENRARMVKSRQKKLNDRWGLERSDKGTRCVHSFALGFLFLIFVGSFKLNRDLGGYHLTSRDEVKIDDLDKPIKLKFPDPEPMRFPGALVSASNVSFAYPGSATKVVDDVTLTIHPGARVGLVGQNGEGKSTLIKLLIGNLHPQKGTIERHSRLRLGYFDQHSVEMLSGPEAASSSALEYFTRQLKLKHSIEIDEQTGRSFLGSFGLRGRTATNPISTLSGGQKVRVHDCHCSMGIHIDGIPVF